MAESSITRRDAIVGAASTTPPAETAELRTKATLWQRIGGAIPTLLVLVVLAGLAVWGHQSNWTIPKFSTLIGGASVEADDWCKDHNVPESICIECHPDLLPLPADIGWCKEHGVAPCPLDHPGLIQLSTVPNITEADRARASSALSLRPRVENNSRCELHEHRIQFASAAAVEKSGVDIAIALQRPIVEAIIANGEVVYDQTHAAQLASRVAGTVWRVEKQVGDKVKKDEVLALIDAAEVGLAKAEFLQAITQVRLKKPLVDRMQPLTDDGSVPMRQFREAQATLQEAQIRLRSAQQSLVNLGLPVFADDYAEVETDQIADRIQFLGVPAAIVAGADIKTTTSNLFPLRSPLEGIVVSRKIVPGEVVGTNVALMGVADVRQMWLTLDVRQDDARFLALGQTVFFQANDGHNREIRGTLAWISTEADDQTRTVKARVDLPNVDGRLRANTFGTGRIMLRDEPRAIMVPTAAVHRDGDCNVIFVRDKNFLQSDAPKFFHVRKVRTGVVDGDLTEIIVGVWLGEVVASKNSVVLESQLLKSTLGAGCCEACAPKK